MSFQILPAFPTRRTISPAAPPHSPAPHTFPRSLISSQLYVLVRFHSLSARLPLCHATYLSTDLFFACLFWSWSCFWILAQLNPLTCLPIRIVKKKKKISFYFYICLLNRALGSNFRDLCFYVSSSTHMSLPVSYYALIKTISGQLETSHMCPCKQSCSVPSCSKGLHSHVKTSAYLLHKSCMRWSQQSSSNLRRYAAKNSAMTCSCSTGH